MDADAIASAIRLESARCDPVNNALTWLEGRSGRGVLCVSAGDSSPAVELTGIDAHAEVGYGGGEFSVHGGRVFVVCRDEPGIRVLHLETGRVVSLGPRDGRCVSPTVSQDGEWVAFVHEDPLGTERLLIQDTSGTNLPGVLSEGCAFYMQPRFQEDGRHIAWITWRATEMPWDGAELWIGDLTTSTTGGPVLEHIRPLAGARDVAVFQPEFSASDQIVFVSDDTGWGRLCRISLATNQRRWLSPHGIEHGTAAWSHDLRTFALLPDRHTAVAVQSSKGFHALVRIDLHRGEAVELPALADYTEISQVVSAARGNRVVFVGSGPRIPPRLVEHDLDSGRSSILARSWSVEPDSAGLADCEAVSWNSEGGELVHGLFYAPVKAADESGLPPPLIVVAHGGPTSQAEGGWNPWAQFFATRGYAVLFVNYRGSTGFGREYMLRLRGQWGVYDVEDVVSGARHFSAMGRTDAARTAVLGASAGGFTVLRALYEHPRVFAAGISLYGIADLIDFAARTHRFERRYVDSLVGELPSCSALYRERSPIFNAEAIRTPLALFCGDLDRVVPPEQSERIAAALRRSGTPLEYVVYPGEAHGFRGRATIADVFRRVEAFLARFVTSKAHGSRSSG